MNLIIVILSVITLIVAIVSVGLVLKLSKSIEDGTKDEELRKLKDELKADIDATRRDTMEHINSSFRNYGDLIAGAQSEHFKTQNESLRRINETLSNFSMESEQKLESRFQKSEVL